MQTIVLHALIVRAFVFVLLMALLPRRVVPVSVRASLLVVLLIFFSTAVLKTSGEQLDSGEFVRVLAQRNPDAALASLWPAQAVSGMVSWPEIFVWEILIGALVAVSVSLAAYAAEVFGHAFAGLIFGHFSGEEIRRLRNAGQTPVSLAVLLTFLVALFSTPAFSVLLSGLGRTLVVVPYSVFYADSAKFVWSNAGIGFVSQTAALALVSALLVAGPAFVVSLAVDLLFLVSARFFAPCGSESLAGATRITAVILVLSLSLYAFSAELSQLLLESSDARRVEMIVTSVQKEVPR